MYDKNCNLFASQLFSIAISNIGINYWKPKWNSIRPLLVPNLYVNVCKITITAMWDAQFWKVHTTLIFRNITRKRL